MITAIFSMISNILIAIVFGVMFVSWAVLVKIGFQCRQYIMGIVSLISAFFSAGGLVVTLYVTFKSLFLV